MAEIPRRPTRKTHLDASVAPVERALLARARTLDETAESLKATTGSTSTEAGVSMIAIEFRALAEELHYW